MPKKSASMFIAQSLYDAGVRNVYGGHGGALAPLVDAVVEHEGLRWVYTRNEANASLMAAADSKLTGASRIAACIATSGPGASNLVTGLLDAQAYTQHSESEAPFLTSCRLLSPLSCSLTSSRLLSARSRPDDCHHRNQAAGGRSAF